MNLWLKSNPLGELSRLETPRPVLPSLLLPAFVFGVWFVTLMLFHPQAVTDETGHIQTIRQFATGDWHEPDLMMIPGYHALLSVPGRLFGVQESWVRLVSVMFSVLTIGLFTQAARTFNRSRPQHTMWLAALLPILFPFTALAYTEAASVLFLFAGVLFHLRRRFVVAAVFLLAACLMRQSNVIWVGFLAVWSAVDVFRQKGFDREAAAGWLHSCFGYAVIFVLAAVFMVVRGGMTWVPSTVHNSGVNPAQFFSFVAWFGLLTAPLLIDALRHELQATTRRGWLIRAAVGLTMTLLLVTLYENAHAFNQEPYYLRNRPLLLMGQSLLWRFLGSVFVVAVVGLAWSALARQRHRVLLGFWAVFSLLFVLAHPPIEPRYYVIPMLLFHLFVEYTPGQMRKLVGWYAVFTLVLCAGMAAEIWML